ncbi:hypothetical protein KIPB_007426, partial [Kipferlia bialata]|eukprot:g7426.t1
MTDTPTLESSLYRHVRTIGVVATETPFALDTRGTDNFLAVSTGCSFAVYNAAKLRLVIHGPQMDSEVTALALYNDWTVAACGHRVSLYRRSRLVSSLPPFSAPVALRMVGKHLVCLATDGEVAVVPLAGQSEETRRYRLPMTETDGSVSAFIHPNGIGNSLLVGTQSGRLELHDFSSRSLLRRYTGFEATLASLALQSSKDARKRRLQDIVSGAGPQGAVALPEITCIAQSTHHDYIAVGTASGHIIIHDIKKDESLLSFRVPTGVSALSFK